MAQVLDDVVDGDDRKCFHSECVADFRESAALAGAAFISIDRDDEAGQRDIGCSAEERHGFPYRGPGGRDVLDDEHAIAARELPADETPALAVVLRFLPIETETHVAPAFGKLDGRRGDE